jgi:hypothetical protein
LTSLTVIETTTSPWSTGVPLSVARSVTLSTPGPGFGRGRGKSPPDSGHPG